MKKSRRITKEYKYLQQLRYMPSKKKNFQIPQQNNKIAKLIKTIKSNQ